jgi:predicted peroxiredoxin
MSALDVISWLLLIFGPKVLPTVSQAMHGGLTGMGLRNPFRGEATMKNLTGPIVALILLAVAAAAPVTAQDAQKTIFYNMTTDEAWAAGMALAQANKALEAGYNVVIFLNVRAVFIASKAFVTDSNGAAGKSLQEQLKDAIANGAQAVICPMCMGKAGMTMDDVIDGVVKGGPDVTMKAMTADDTVVISF